MSEMFTRRIGWLLLVPVAGAIALLVVYYLLSARLAPESLFLDIAGRQRLLAEQLAAVATAEPARVRAALAAYEANLSLLADGGTVRGEPVPPPPPEVAAAVASLRDAWQSFKPQLQPLLADRAAAGERAAARERLGVATPRLVTAADAVVVALHAWDRDMRRLMLGLLAVLAILNGVILVAVIVYVAQHGRARQRLARLYTALGETNAAVMLSGSVDALFREVCRIAVKRGGLCGAWIGMADAATETLRPVAQCCMPSDYLERVMVSTRADRPEGRGPAGTALRDGGHVVSNDFLADAGTVPWQVAARAAGIRAVAAFALRQEGRPVGTLNLYAGETGYFTDDLVQLLVKVADDISYALDHHAQQAQRRAAEAALAEAHQQLEARVVERTAQLAEANTRLRAEAAVRKYAHQQLRDSEARLQESQRIAHIGSWELDLRTNRLHWSDEIFRMFEVDAGRFGASYEAFLAAIHPDDREAVDRSYTESVRTGVPYVITHRLRFPDGRIKYVQERGETFRDEDGHPERSIGTVQDVTAQVLADEALRASHQLLDAVFDTTHMMIAYLDTDMNFVRVNRAYAAADGRTPEFFVGQNHFALYPNAENEAVFRRAVETGELVEIRARPFEYAANPERGRSHWDWTLHPIRDPAGQVVGLVLSLLNVSERIQAIEQLEASERDLAALNDVLEQRVAARTAELKAERNLIAAILDVVGALVIVLDRDGQVVRFNKACEALTGYRSDEVEGREFWKLLLPVEEREAVHRVFQELAAGQFPNRHENDWLTRHGERRRIAWSNTCLTGADGAVQYVIGTGVDVTERRRMESALRASEARFRNLVESTSDWIWEIDEHGSYVYASPQVRQLLGFEPEEILGKKPFDFMTPEEARRVDADFGRIAAAQAPFSGLINVNRHRDGRAVVLETSAVPVFDEHGRFRGYRGIDRDITERQRERQALEDSETLFRQMAETIREVFFVRDTIADRIIYVSPSYEQMWGRPRAELYADPTAFVRGVHPDDREAVVSAMAAMRRGEAHFNQEYRVVRPDGRELWVWARAFPVRNAAGETYRVTGLIEDITARKLAEEQRLEHARRQRETLVREVHHRIKNNLQGVVGLLRQHAARQPAAAPLLEPAITQVNAVALVHGLHGRSRDEQLLLCDMVHAIGEAVAGLHGVRVEMAFAPHMPLGIAVQPAEAVPLALIVNEMVINAVKHGGASVRLDLRQEENAIVVEARNPGQLAEEIDVATGRALGTGLSLVRALLPLKGATFVVRNDGADVVAQLRLVAPLVSGFEGLPDAACRAANG